MNLKTNKEHFLMRNLINSIICVLIALSASSQFKTKKFIKRNKKAPTFQYDNSDIYARALYYEDGRLFIGNSDGSLYFYKVSTGKSQLIFNLPDLIVPHPLMQERKFVLIPLLDIASDIMHPLLHMNTHELLAVCKEDSEVVKFG